MSFSRLVEWFRDLLGWLSPWPVVVGQWFRFDSDSDVEWSSFLSRFNHSIGMTADKMWHRQRRVWDPASSEFRIIVKRPAGSSSVHNPLRITSTIAWKLTMTRPRLFPRLEDYRTARLYRDQLLGQLRSKFVNATSWDELT